MIALATETSLHLKRLNLFSKLPLETQELIISNVFDRHLNALSCANKFFHEIVNRKFNHFKHLAITHFSQLPENYPQAFLDEVIAPELHNYFHQGFMLISHNFLRKSPTNMEYVESSLEFHLYRLCEKVYLVSACSIFNTSILYGKEILGCNLDSHENVRFLLKTSYSSITTQPALSEKLICYTLDGTQMHGAFSKNCESYIWHTNPEEVGFKKFASIENRDYYAYIKGDERDFPEVIILKIIRGASNFYAKAVIYTTIHKLGNPALPNSCLSTPKIGFTVKQWSESSASNCGDGEFTLFNGTNSYTAYSSLRYNREGGLPAYYCSIDGNMVDDEIDNTPDEQSFY